MGPRAQNVVRRVTTTKALLSPDLLRKVDFAVSVSGWILKILHCTSEPHPCWSVFNLCPSICRVAKYSQSKYTLAISLIAAMGVWYSRWCDVFIRRSVVLCWLRVHSRRLTVRTVVLLTDADVSQSRVKLDISFSLRLTCHAKLNFSEIS